MNKEIKIIYKPDIESLMKVSKYLLLNLKFIKFFPIYFIILLLMIYSTYLLETNRSYEESRFSINDYLPIFIPPLIFAFIYFRSLSSMKKNLLNNKRNLEQQRITFNNNSYIQEGETFKIESFWNETYEIKETKDWYLIYPKKNSALPIIKSEITSEENNDLRALFLSLPVKKNLK